MIFQMKYLHKVFSPDKVYPDQFTSIISEVRSSENIGDGNYYLKIRRLNIRDISNEYLFDKYSPYSLFDGTPQFFIVKNCRWSNLRNLFFIKKKILSGGNPSYRQWLSNQDFELSLFLKCLEITYGDRDSIKNNMLSLHSKRLRNLPISKKERFL